MIWWYFRSEQIIHFNMKLCYGLMYVPAWAFNAMGFTESWPIHTIQQIAAAHKDAHHVSFVKMLLIMNKSAMLLYPLLWFPYRMRRQAIGHVILRLRQTHGFWSLMKYQAKIFHCIVPVVRFETYWLAHPDERAKWRRRAEMPDEWVARKKLIKHEGGEIILDIAGTEKAFRAQMDAAKRYLSTSPDVKSKNPLSLMTDYEKALFSVFACRIVGANPDSKKNKFSRNWKSRSAAKALLGIVNSSCVPGKDPRKSFTFTEVAAKAESYLASPIIAAMVNDHNYCSTLLMRLLFEARKDGKLPCSWFIWLKIVDPQLWYSMQGVTYRQIARNFIEAAPVCAQFWSEMTAIDNDQSLRGDWYSPAIPALEHVLLKVKVITSTSKLYNESDF